MKTKVRATKAPEPSVVLLTVLGRGVAYVVRRRRAMPPTRGWTWDVEALPAAALPEQGRDTRDADQYPSANPELRLGSFAP